MPLLMAAILPMPASAWGGKGIALSRANGIVDYHTDFAQGTAAVLDMLKLRPGS
jgi:hypothetical protein